jgi:DNA repair protein RecO (recombination protein O)
MLEKTRGIVLRQIKFTDSGIIAQMYTRKLGRQSFLIRGIRKRKTGKHIPYQPLLIIDLEFYFKAKREIQLIKESSVFYSPADVYSNIKKSSVAIFLGEVLSSVLKEESPHEELFDFIEESIIYFDNCSDNFANFHIAFLAGLSSFLGFEPAQRFDRKDKYFDMLNGIFVETPPLHGNYADEEITDILADFYKSSYDSVSKISLNGKMRNDVLETILRFYSLHLPGLKRIKSLEILKEVYS